jgi:hypothetical protein
LAREETRLKEEEIIMDMVVVVTLGGFAALVVLLYFMFGTRRTVLRIFGWTVFLFSAIGFIFININTQSRSGAELTMIVNDLRTLSSAALLFYVDFGVWPLPGQEASLDVYLDRPIVFAKPPRYAKVMLADKSGNTDGPPELYIGVELIPPENGVAGLQESLARMARSGSRSLGLLQQPVSGDIYRSGLSVLCELIHIRNHKLKGSLEESRCRKISWTARLLI